MSFDADPRRSAAHRNLAAHLAGPLREGAAESTLALAADGTARIDWVSRSPLLLVELRAPLAQHGLSITVTVTADGGAPDARALDFAAFSEAGAALAGWIGPITDGAPPATVALAARGLAAGAALGDAVEVRVVEGVLGRLLYAIGSEKARVRRQLRELHELRRLSFPFDDTPEHRRMGNALDRLGAELAVPRLTDHLSWDAANNRPASATAAEPNESYRARLELYRAFVLPTRSRIERRLRDYTGATAATVTESNTELAVALKLVSAPDDAPRLAFLAWLKSAHLIQPGAPLPPARLLPSRTRAQLSAALARIAAGFAWPANASVAPALALVLDRVARCRSALGVARPWTVLRAQDDAGGSRFELGLAVELEVPPAAELDALGAALRANQLAAGTDPDTLALLASLAPQPAAADPVGRWLLGPAGARTVHATAAGELVSHAQMASAVLVPDGAAASAFQARFEAPGDPGQNAVLWFALRDVAADMTAASIPAWTAMARAAEVDAVNGAVVPAQAVVDAIAAAGLRAPATADELARAKAAFAALPPELVAVLALPAALASGIAANAPASVAQLAAIARACEHREIASILPLKTAGGMVLAVSAVKVAGASSLGRGERLAFRWYAVGIEGTTGALTTARGARSTYVPPAAVPATPSLAAVVAVSLARAEREDPRGRIAPYTARVDVPDGALVDLATFERLMNFLERVAPIGVVIDTQHLRAAAVDAAGTGHAIPLTGRLAHSFREYQQHRHRGAVIDDPPR